MAGWRQQIACNDMGYSVYTLLNTPRIQPVEQRELVGTSSTASGAK